MKPFHSLLTGTWIIIGLNLIMAFGAIWLFQRMAPAIEIILDQNDKSLKSVESMLSSIATRNLTEEDNKSLNDFQLAYQSARGNITEIKEQYFLDTIERNYHAAFQGDPVALKITVESIRSLANLNRSAMIRADHRAQQLGNTGAWGIAFMSIFLFIVIMIFKRGLRNNLLLPMEEIYDVLEARQNGDYHRRFYYADMPFYIKKIFLGLNNILDK